MLLALDTATRHLSVALHDGQRLLAESSWRTGANPTVELAPQVAAMLQRANAGAGQLRGVAVALGPGSYTSLRIGLGLAKGLALTHSLALLGVPTFEIILRAQPPRPGPIMAVIQAGRGRISAQAYQWQASGWAPTTDWHITTWAALAETLTAPTYICGEVDEPGYALLQKLGDQVTLAPGAQTLRRAGWLAEIGWERLRAGRVDDPAQLAPIYGGPLETTGA